MIPHIKSERRKEREQESARTAEAGEASTIVLQRPQSRAAVAFQDWPVWNGSPGNQHYSSLSQINRSNVKQLQTVWTYDRTAGRETGMADTSTHIFRASLRGRLYRDIELPSSGSLEDVAAAIAAEMTADTIHQHPLPDLQGRDHRGTGDPERLDDERLDEDREPERDRDDHDEFDQRVGRGRDIMLERDRFAPVCNPAAHLASLVVETTVWIYQLCVEI